MVGANPQVGSAQRPGDARDDFILQVEELGDLGGSGIPRRGYEDVPEVYAGVEGDTQVVLVAPVYEVEVKVVLELWGVEHLEGHLGNLADVLAVVLREGLGEGEVLMVDEGTKEVDFEVTCCSSMD